MLGRNVEIFSFVLPFLPSTKKGVFFRAKIGAMWMNSTSLSHLKKKPGGVQQLISESESDGTGDEDDEGVRESGRTQGTIRKLFQAGAILVWFLADCSGCLAVFGCFGTSADQILESVWHATFNFIKPHL